MIDRWVRTKSDEAAVDVGCWYDQRAVDRVRYFFERFLRHSKGEFANKKFELLDWEYDRVVAPAFGWKMPDGRRRFTQVGVGVAKKNGKSTLLAGLGLYMLVGDGEAGAEVYSAAGSRDQASIIYNEAANMVDASPALQSHVALKRTAKEMTFGNCFYKALSADVPTKEGLNTHCLLFDELHAQPNWDLWNVLHYSFAARRQPLLFWISTAGVYDQESVCWQQWQRAKAVQESTAVDISFLPCVYETEEADDWESEETWKKANPSLGVMLRADEFRTAVDQAKAMPRMENEFRRYRLNQWTRQAVRWINMERWNACRAVYDEKDLLRQKCIGGLDLAATTDIAALVLLFRDLDKYRLWPIFWLPRGALERRRRENKTRMDAWANKYIRLTPGDVLDYKVIRRDMNRLAKMFKITKQGIDPWNATQVAVDLEDDGFPVEYVRTGYTSISGATKEFERLVLEGGLEHPGNPVLDWMVGNVAIEQDAGGLIKPSKRRSSEKIDGVVAAIIALALSLVARGTKPTVYESRGILEI
jgi:phage terminase large subunit-like protein